MKGLWLCVLAISALCSCAWVHGVAAQSNNSTDDEQIVADINGQILRYGPSNTFNIRLYNVTFIFTTPFYFGLGDPQDEVETDTPLSLGTDGSLVVCQNGTANSGFQGSTPPQNGLFIVRANRTFGFYTLQLANSSTTGIQFNGLSAQYIFQCTPNASSTPIQFMSNSKNAASPSSHSVSPFLPLLYSLVSLCLITLYHV